MDKKPTPSPRSISLDLVCKFTISAIYYALAAGSVGVATAIIASLLGSSLPIVTNGFFYPLYYISEGVRYFESDE